MKDRVNTADRAAIAAAFEAGFLAGLDNERWDDAPDFACLAGLDYADSKPLPTTMPSGRLKAQRDQLLVAVERARMVLKAGFPPFSPREVAARTILRDAASATGAA